MPEEQVAKGEIPGKTHLPQNKAKEKYWQRAASLWNL